MSTGASSVRAQPVRCTRTTFATATATLRHILINILRRRADLMAWRWLYWFTWDGLQMPFAGTFVALQQDTRTQLFRQSPTRCTLQLRHILINILRRLIVLAPWTCPKLACFYTRPPLCTPTTFSGPGSLVWLAAGSPFKNNTASLALVSLRHFTILRDRRRARPFCGRAWFLFALCCSSCLVLCPVCSSGLLWRSVLPDHSDLRGLLRR